MPYAGRMMICWIIFSLWSIVGVSYIVGRQLRPQAAWAWATAMILCPPLTTLIYYLAHLHPHRPSLPQRREAYTRLQNLIANECGSALTLRNKVRTLHNANHTFAALIRDLHHAKEQINVEYYILGSDRVGEAIMRLLQRRARAGVRVRVIYDAVGSWRLDRARIKALQDSGIEARAYSPMQFPFITASAHRRNHRKVVTIDSRIAYIGGINIASRYIDGGRLGFWRDEHLRIEGAAVEQLQALFVADWRRVGGGEIEKIKPQLRISTSCAVQIAWAQEGRSRMALHHAFAEAIASARRNIRISTPYFIPPTTLLDAICRAARAGVEVELLVPMVGDVALVAQAAEGYIRHCVGQGVRVYRYRNGFLHSKTVTIDEAVTVIGSANIDYRSLYYNLEASAIIYNREVTMDYISRFYADVALSEPLDAERHMPQSPLRCVVQGLARLLAPLL